MDKQSVPYDEKIEEARAWMEARRIHQLGTEHLRKQQQKEETENV